MKGILSFLKIIGMVFSIAILLGVIGSFVIETKPNITRENETKEIVVQVCIPNSTACQDSYIKKCKEDGSGWIEYYEYCYWGCVNGTCKLYETPVKTCVDECIYTGQKGCSGNYTTLCGNWDVDECLEWKVIDYCYYGCEAGACKQAVISKLIVTRVIDGDTVELNTGERVRLILIDAPESGEECYKEAKSRLEQLVLNKEVRLEKDVSETDRYGRLLRYVYVGSTFVNYQLVREGLAYASPYPPDIKYKVQIEEAQKLAEEEAVGCLWKKKVFSFSLALNPSSGNVVVGGSVNTILEATLLNGSATNIIFSCSNLPSGVTCNFSPTSCSPTCSSTLTISTSSSTPTGTYTITINGIGEGVTNVTTYTLTVTTVPQPFNFSLSTNPTSSKRPQGGYVSIYATANLLSGTTTPVSFSCSGLPDGASCNFSPSSCSPTCTSTLVITTSLTTSFGVYTITISGIGGGLTRTTIHTLNISSDCHPSYPTLCIPPPPPDLDCSDIPYRRFEVRWDIPDPDPHKFDGDKDGIGCEA